MIPTLSPEDWHIRFSQQVRWTQPLQKYLTERIGLTDAQDILEVGCGTGAFLSSLKSHTPARLFGLDKNRDFLSFTSRTYPDLILTEGDAHRLPYPESIFTIALCHFLLLWVKDPIAVIKEMARVTRPGGFVLAVAEPDYGGRIDFPNDLSKLRQLQQRSLQSQGANPYLGRQLRMIFHRASLVDIETGVLGGQWSGNFIEVDWEAEWSMIYYDLEGILPTDEIFHLKARDRQAWKKGERILFVPTFYTWGRVPLR